MNQGKLELVKQEMARVNMDILGICELKWTEIILSFFEIAPKNCISDSFVDYDGYSISCKDLEDVMGIWIKFTHSCLFYFTDS